MNNNKYKLLSISVAILLSLFLAYGLYDFFFVERSITADNIVSGKTFETVGLLKSERINFVNIKEALDNTFDRLNNIGSPINPVKYNGKYNPFSSVE
jgi:hypothetical protein